MADPQNGHTLRRLEALENALRSRARDLAVFLVFDRPSLVAKRPALARTFFAERCAPDAQLELMVEAFRAVDAYAELFESDHAFLAALSAGLRERTGRSLMIAYNGLGYSVGEGAFEPGRKSLIPLIADSYGMLCANADPYACALTLHKFHCFRLLQTLGINAPKIWFFRPNYGWVGRPPPPETKVIVKSNYESWSVGVTDESVFIVDESCTDRVAAAAERVGQPMAVQEFIAGQEIYVPVMSCPRPIACTPVELILKHASDHGDTFMTIDDVLADEGSYRPLVGESEIIDRLQLEAREVVNVLDLRGLSRIDFRIDENGTPWVFDIAISPGVGAEGAAFTSLAQCGFDYPAFIRLVIATTLGAHGLL